MVNLETLKRLVEELDSTLSKADEIKSKGASSSKLDFTVEMNKATGLAAGILTESGFLMADIQSELQGSQNINQSKAIALIDKLLAGGKDPEPHN